MSKRKREMDRQLDKMITKKLSQKEDVFNKYLKDIIQYIKIPENIPNKERGITKLILALEKQIAFLNEIREKKQNNDLNSQIPIQKLQKQATIFANLTTEITIQKEIKKREESLDEIIKYYGKNQEENPFTSFYGLSLIIENFYMMNYLDEQECLDIIIYFINKNIELNILEPNGIEKIENTHTLDRKILSQIQENHILKEKIKLISKIINIEDKDFKENLISATKIIKEQYLDKSENYTKEDIDTVIKAFKRLQIIFTANDIIKVALLKKWKKNNTSKKQKGIINTKIKTKAIEILPFTRIKINPLEQSSIKIKEKPIEIVPYTRGILPTNEAKKEQIKPLKTMKELMEEVKKYIDLYDFKLKKELLPKEKFYIMNLLSSLDKEKEEIRTFISIADLNIENLILKSDLNILRKIFAENREKYYFYYQIKGYTQLEESIHFLEESFDLLATENDIDFRKALTTEIRQELITLENSLPATYEYEFRKMEKQKILKK